VRLDVELEPFGLGGQSYAVSPAVVGAELAVQRATSGLVFRLRFAVDAHGPCMRCLDDAVVHLSVDVLEYHDALAVGDEELTSDYVADDQLSLSSLARDSVALALPDPILCRPDCAGLCPACGKNLNVEPHAHEEAAPDPRWAALDALVREVREDR
jgi:uncharacterized protein